jgi:hypothetical protein
MRWGLAVSARGQTGQSDAIHSPEAWGERCSQIDHAGRRVDRGRLQNSYLLLAERLAHDVEPTGEWRVAEAAFAFP